MYFELQEPYENYEDEMAAFNDATEDFLADIDTTASDAEIALQIHDNLIDQVTYDDVYEEALMALVPEATGTAFANGIGTQAASSSSSSGHTYTLVQMAVTWDDAEAYCEAHGGHLATITSRSEYQTVLDAVEGSDVRVCWVGGYLRGSSWRWVSGETFSYAPWASGEPNNDGGIENRLALLENANDEWGWYDCPNDVSSTYRAYRIGFVMETE